MLLTEQLYKTLQDDAKLTTAGCLGHVDLLDKPAEAPYGVFAFGPPKKPDFPMLTWYDAGEVEKMPRSFYIMITAWGANYGVILERVYQLLHEKTQLFVDITDYHVVRCEWNWGGTVVEDPDYRIYTQANRYWIEGVKL